MAIVHTFLGAVPALLRRALRALRSSAEAHISSVSSIRAWSTPAWAPSASSVRPAPFSRGGGGGIFLPGTLPGNRFRAGRARPDSLAGPGARSRILLAPFRRLAREQRASAGLEFALWTALVLLPVALLAFDVISLARASTAGARVAATMADYVSRESEPDGDKMDELGAFLHEREFRNPSALVYVISAVHKLAGDKSYPKVWPDQNFIIRSGDSETTTDLLARCQTQGTWHTALSGDEAVITLQDNDVVIVVEVCVKMLREGILAQEFSGILYRIHAMPARGSGGAPAAPTRSSRSEEAAMPARVDAGTVASLHGSLDPTHQSVGLIGQAPAVLGVAA